MITKISGCTPRKYHVGDLVTRARNPREQDYTPVVVGRVIRDDATEEEFMSTHPDYREGLAAQPDCRALYTWAQYFEYELVP